MSASESQGAPLPPSESGETSAASNLLEPSASVLQPPPGDVEPWTDRYFVKTKQTIGRFGDKTVCYAVFMRRPVIFTPRLMVRWLQQVAEARGIDIGIDVNYQEGDWVGAGEPLLYITGSFYHLVDLETLYLQKLGAPCVAAYNAFTMCSDLPKVGFLAMDARHCAGIEMAEMMAYAAAVGSEAAKRQSGARGFIGNANDATAHYFGQAKGLGTMPHALIGYAGSTLRAAEMFAETFPGDDLTVLVDYFGREVSDLLEVCRRFPESRRGRAVGGTAGHPRRPLPGGARSAGILCRSGAQRAARSAPLSQRHRTALSHRHRRFRRGNLSHARTARPRRLPARPHRRLLRLRRAEVQGDGRCRRTD